MGIWKAGMLALLVACAGVRAGERPDGSPAGESVLTMRVDGELTIGPDGQVVEYKVRTPLEPRLQEMLAKAIPSWRLKPVLQNGKPVGARTPMRITLAATQAAEGYQVRIDNVVFAPLTAADREAARAAAAAARARGEVLVTAGEQPLSVPDIRRVKTNPPVYPRGLASNGMEGMVLMVLRLQPDGRVADAVASQSTLFNVKGRPEVLDKARAMLERVSLAAARSWTFDVDAADPGSLTPRALSLSIAVDFAMAETPKEQREAVGVWRWEFRGPQQFAPWLRKVVEEQVVGVSDLAGGEFLAGSSPFRLADPGIIGRVL